MSKRSKLYIAYGSNLNRPQMAFRCPAAKVVGSSELENYELLFRGGRRGAVATVEPKEGSKVPVLLWKITQEDEEALDRYEGYPSFYRKRMMEVELGGETVSAMVYVMTSGYQFGVPSDHYADVIRQGYEEAGFDTQILDDAINHVCELTIWENRQSEGNRQQSLLGLDGWSGQK